MAGSVRVVLKSVFDDKGIKSAQSEFAKVGKTIGGVLTAVGAAVTVAGVGIAKFGASSVEAASTLEESLNAVNVAYGGASKSIVKLGEDAAQRLGVTQSAFNAAAVRFSAFAERVVGEGGNVTGFLDDITTRAADFASVFNIDVAEALQVFQSGLSGEAEPLKRFGINLLDSEVKAYALRTGLIAVGETMTEQEKVQARYGLLMEATAKTQGDFANTSGSLANSQRILQASFEDLQAEVGTALLPVFADATKEFGKMIGPLRDALVPAAENLAIAFRTKAIPALQDFTKFLASPEGTKRVNDFVQAVVFGIEKVVNFAVSVVENWESIKNQLVVITSLTVALGALRTALQLATAAQLLFNSAVFKNPYVIAAAGITTLIGGLIALDVELLGSGATTRKAEEAAKGFTGRVAELVAQEKRLQEQLGKGAIGTHQYREAVTKVRTELNTLQGQLLRTGREAQNLNNVKLGGLRGQLSAAAGEANRFRNILASIPATKVVTTVTGGGTGSTGPTLKEQRAAAAKDFSKLVKDTKEQIAEAKSVYQKAVSKAGEVLANATQQANDAYSKAIEDATNGRNSALKQAAEDNARTVESINKAATDRLAGIVRESIDRLRNAYASAVSVDVGKLFGEEAVGKSVDKLVQNLRDKLAASRRLVANASALSAQGFSQTFIEQVVSAGTSAGNELSEAILNATPETRNELQSLFGALENESETGMDALSKEIYDKAGLATNALKSLYANTQNELTVSLQKQAEAYATQQANIMREFDDALKNAKVARDKALADANKAYTDSIKAAFDEYKGDLDKIEKEYKDKLGGITGLSAALTIQSKALLSQIGTAGNFKPTVTGTTNDLLMLNAATLAQSQAAPQTTINLTVNAGMGVDGADVGRRIVDEIVRFERSSGAVFARAV